MASPEAFFVAFSVRFVSRNNLSNAKDRFPVLEWIPLGKRRLQKNLMSPATPNRTPFSLSRTRAGGVIRPTGPIGRDGRLAPDRDGTPALARASSRVPRALQRAKNGQRAPEAPLGVASDSPIENRAGAAFAHGDAGAARHVRDDRRRRYVGARAEPCARSNRANPPRTRRGPRGRAPHTSIIRSKTSVCCVCCAKRAVPRFPTLHAFPRRFRGFVKRETARARRKRSRRDWKNREKESSSRSLFSPKKRKIWENRPTPVCRLVKWQKLRRALFGFTRARFFFFHPRSGAAADSG